MPSPASGMRRRAAEYDELVAEQEVLGSDDGARRENSHDGCDYVAESRSPSDPRPRGLAVPAASRPCALLRGLRLELLRRTPPLFRVRIFFTRPPTRSHTRSLGVSPLRRHAPVGVGAVRPATSGHWAHGFHQTWRRAKTIGGPADANAPLDGVESMAGAVPHRMHSCATLGRNARTHSTLPSRLLWPSLSDVARPVHPVTGETGMRWTAAESRRCRALRVRYLTAPPSRKCRHPTRQAGS